MLQLIDIVEGTALESFERIHDILSHRPKVFASVEHAVRWGYVSHFRYGPSSIDSLIRFLRFVSSTVRNLESAKVSIPPQLEAVGGKYGWKVNLPASSKYWEGAYKQHCEVCVNYLPDCRKGWYKGLSSKFLSVVGPKELILAGTDRLDTELIIGQMQGKYQLKLLPQCGHCIQEDVSTHPPPPPPPPSSFFFFLVTWNIEY